MKKKINTKIATDSSYFSINLLQQSVDFLRGRRTGLDRHLTPD